MAQSPAPVGTATQIRRVHPDVLAIGIFVVCLAVAMWHRWVYDNWLAEFDIMTFFVPWFAIIGDRLREGDIPGWTRYFSSGSPVAGDPSAGWMYFPVMVLFSIWKVQTAFKLMVLIQTLIGGISIYAFSRVIGLRPIAATMSMFAFGFGAFFYGQTQFATVACQVATWIPVGLLGVELALRTPNRIYKIASLSLAGLAISQMAAAWMGQGFFNGLLVMGGWVFYRAIVSPPPNIQTMRERVVQALIVGPSIVILGLLLGAAGLIPKLSINAQSSIAGGDYSLVLGGDYESERNTLPTLFHDMLIDDLGWRPIGISAITLLLAIMGIFLARRRHFAPYFAAVYVLSCVLTLNDTPIHHLFYLIPEFEKIHEHSPRRMIWVMTFAPAMLAGIAVQELPRWRHHAHAVKHVLVPAGIMAAIVLYIGYYGTWVGQWVYWVVLLGTLIALAVVLPWPRLTDQVRNRLTISALTALIVITFVAPPLRDIVYGVLTSDGTPRGAFMKTDEETNDLIDLYTADAEPNSAAAFLQDQQANQPPFRYVGYSGRFYPDPTVNATSYSQRRTAAGPMAVLVSGRGAFLGLDQLQGYNPTHLKHYMEYFDAMNGASQDYHWFDPFPSAMDESQLFNMLNARYIVVSRTIPENRADILAIAAGKEIVYQDEKVTIYENPDAFERAWIVHQVRPNNDGDCLPLFQSNALDARVVACIDGDLPAVTQLDPEQAGTESVTMTFEGDDKMAANATLAVPGLVVFSEVYAKGWNAYVDGKRVDLLRTDHALRGVPVPAGTHLIEMRYEPWEITTGLWVSGVTGFGMLASFGLAGVAWLRGGHPLPAPAPDPLIPAMPDPLVRNPRRRRRSTKRRRTQ